MSYSVTHQTDDPRGAAYSVRMLGPNVVITLQPHCRPDRTPEWEARARALTESPAVFQRQYGLNWSTPGGNAFYPECADKIHEVAPWEFEGIYVHKADGLLEGAPIYVGHDFGYHRPAFVAAQYDDPAKGGSGIIWYLREAKLDNMVAHEAAALCRFLTGRATEEDLASEGRKQALRWIERERKEKFYGYEMPWFQPGEDIIDVSAEHEKEILSGLAPSEEELTWARQYMKQGIRVIGRPTNWQHAETVMRHVLREGRIPGQPRAWFDPSCKWLLKGLAGGLVQPTNRQRFGGPKRDKLYEDVHDCACHIARAIYRRADLSPLEESDREYREQFVATARVQFPVAQTPRRPIPVRRPLPTVSEGTWARPMVHSWE